MSNQDPVWDQLRQEAEKTAASEKLLSSFLEEVILSQTSLERAISFHLAQKLDCQNIPAITLFDLFLNIAREDKTIQDAIRTDLRAISDRDPASNGILAPFLYFKGFHSLTSYRFGHHLWQSDRTCLALFLQSLISEQYGVDIHPAARIGKGILIDHATCLVIGETAVVGNNVSILHDVTLGGTGKDKGDRHPKVAAGVLIGAGAKILGNVKIGIGAKIGAGSVVLDHVPNHCSAAGVPAKIVGKCEVDQPALSMDHQLEHDPVI
ncbi:MAG: serine O-acetyltransferase [Opitutales bacterium]|nr:serine O-acetyltransferase [Opitutales bacterium]